RGAVPDGRTGSQVPPEGRAVADELGGEQRDELGDERNGVAEPSLDLGEGESRPDLDSRVADLEGLELLELIERDRQRRAVEAHRDVDAPVGTASQEHGARFLP